MLNLISVHPIILAGRVSIRSNRWVYANHVAIRKKHTVGPHPELAILLVLPADCGVSRTANRNLIPVI